MWSTRDPYNRWSVIVYSLLHTYQGFEMVKAYLNIKCSKFQKVPWSLEQAHSSKTHRPSFKKKLKTKLFLKIITYQINHKRRDVLLNEGTSRSLKRPLCGDDVVASSTTNRPRSIGLPLSLAIFSKVSRALSVCPLAT
jgi:hypothetical protein